MMIYRWRSLEVSMVASTHPEHGPNVFDPALPIDVGSRI